MRLLGKNAADCVEPDVIGDVDLLDMSVIFAADNVDQNIITIDDKETFHGMPRVSLPLSPPPPPPPKTDKPSYSARTDLGAEN